MCVCVCMCVCAGVRLEAEQCDSAPNFLMLHSLGGGTGSGLGSRLLEAVREVRCLVLLRWVFLCPLALPRVRNMSGGVTLPGMDCTLCDSSLFALTGVPA